MAPIDDVQRGEMAHPDEALTSYCFGGLSDAERDAVEQHLMLCNACWAEFRRLDAAVRTLRASEAVTPTVSTAEAVTIFGISREFVRPFAGHTAFVLVVGVLFGLEWMIGLWSELGYSYDRFGSLAWALSAPVGVWATVTLLLGLWFDVRATRGGQTNGLMRSVLVNVLGLGTLVAALMVVLPAERTVQASFQTRTASAGYLKDAQFIFAPLLVFVLPAFHAVVRLQQELAHGRFRPVLGILSRDEHIAPRNMLYLSPRLLGAFLAVYGIVKLVGANHMLDALTPGPYAQLFTVASYISTGVWFAIPIIALWWYTSALNELRREASAIRGLTRP